MQRTSFILALALLVVATTLAITITVRKPARTEASASEPTTRSNRLPGSHSRQRSAVAPSTTPAKSARHAEAPRSFSVRAPESHPQRTRLVESAEMVASDANLQLARLTKQLELTGEQRRRLFPILARASKHYDPALEVSGLPAGTSALVGSAGNREVDQVLEPPQRDQLVENAVTDQILWQEIIDNLRQRLDEQTPQLPVADPPEVPGPATPAPRGRGNLFEVVEPQP
jgi:hypothetical protein